MRKMLQRPPRRKTLIAVTAALLAGALAAALLFPESRAHWLAFFGGILVAVFSVLAGITTRSAWIIKRRTRQLDRMREKLDEQTARGDTAADALRAARERLKVVNDALPVPMLYFDAEQRCRYHNPAGRKWLGLAPDRIDGRYLADIAGDSVSAEMQPFIRETLGGKTVEYEVIWHGGGSDPEPVHIRQVPWAPGGKTVVGFYLMTMGWAAPPAAAKPPPELSADSVIEALAEADGPDPAAAAAGGEDRALYLQSITEDIMGAVDDPRAKLTHAMAQDEFLLFVQRIQPIAPGKSGDAYEILLRLKEEEDNLLPPGGFIPIAERYGMLSQLDLWVVARLIRWCQEQQQAEPDWQAPLFCVNLSEASLLDPAFAQRVKAEITNAKFPGTAICFEVGEPEALNHHPEVANLIATLKPAGCRFTIDAFGSNRVSFSYLRGLPVDFVKIDGNIVHNIVRDPGELAKARAIHRVCHTIGVSTIAESVEQDETLNLLRDIGIDYVQGFGIAAPAPIAMLAATPGEPGS